MFDLTSGKLLLLGIVALIVLGPKDFPLLLRTIGKYMGIIKRQADEFRDQFNEAIRESEFDQIKKEVEGLGREAETSLKDTERSIAQDFDSARADLDAQLDDPLKPSPHTSGYTPEALRETSAGETAAVPDPADLHEGYGMPAAPAAGADSLPPDPKPAAAEPRSLNGSGGHSDHAAAAEGTPKSGA